jgi:hypothetical protein
MSMAQSKRNLIAAAATAALLIAVVELTTTPAVLAQVTGGTTTGGGGGGTTTGGGGGAPTVWQGTVTSRPDLLPGHTGDQAAVILQPRTDGRVYTGVITYTASRTVDVQLLQMQKLNSTQQLILNATSSRYGSLETSKLNNRTDVAITSIRPGSASASIPFAANAVILHSTGSPFIAAYTVSASTAEPQSRNDITNVTSSATAGGGGGGGGG